MGSAQQFLSSVLSQCGPSGLPYSEDVKWLIRQHLLALVEAYPSLRPQTATFAHNDGRTVNLLQAEGTVPMLYQAATYNIPIVIWLTDSYPRQPPCVYLNPTRDMVIKRPHPFVNPSGMVAIPYLHNWIYPTSNLVDLARNLSDVFARDPPLYSSPTPPTPLTPTPRQYSPSEDPAEAFRRSAVNKLVHMAHKDVAALTNTREAEMEGIFNAQSVLRQREQLLFRGLRDMISEKEALEQKLQMVLMNADMLEAWLTENADKVHKLANLDPDHVFQPCDALSNQIINSTSSDLAIEDAIYSLDKASQEGAIPFDLYLRTVRSLSREQFFHRATASKVRAVHMQSQVANMAARISHYVAS
uniref:Protein ELC-like n=1 Tax=Kalanchoe fedtschenkoi TaxID=63787 RepID=A0A7N0T2Z3_KALFE